MNRSFTKSDSFDSNNGIYKMIYEDFGMTDSGVPGVRERVLGHVSEAVALLTGTAARRIAKVCAVALSLVGMVGVVGAMDHGSLSIPAGLGICALLLGVEYLCLRNKQSAKPASSAEDQEG